MNNDPIDLDFDYEPTKTFSELLAEGIPHKGGLAQLASVEAAAQQRSTEAKQSTSAQNTSPQNPLDTPLSTQAPA